MWFDPCNTIGVNDNSLTLFLANNNLYPEHVSKAAAEPNWVIGDPFPVDVTRYTRQIERYNNNNNNNTDNNNKQVPAWWVPKNK